MTDHPCPQHSPSSTEAPPRVSGVATEPLPTPFPHLLSCAWHRCFTPVTEASAVSYQGPIRLLCSGQASPGPYGKRGSLGQTLCLPGRLQENDPQALRTAQPHWPASHGGSEAALDSLLPVLFYFVSYPEWERRQGWSLCSALFRPHPGTTLSLQSQTGDTIRWKHPSTGGVTLSYKEIRLVKQELPYIHPC